jgi:hypothetical protein
MHYQLIYPSDTERHPRQPGWQMIMATGPNGQETTHNQGRGQSYFTLLQSDKPPEEKPKPAQPLSLSE